MDLKKFKIGIVQLAEEKGIPEEKVVEIIGTAMAAAYKKDYGQRGQKIVADLDFDSGKINFWQVKQVVDESMILSEQEIAELDSLPQEQRVGLSQDEEIIEEERKIRFNPERHIMLEEAKKFDSKAELGGEIKIALEMREDYGRIAAQTAKQVILQKIKESEREMLLAECKEKESDIISGTVQRIGMKDVFFDIGKTLGILSKEEQIPGEFYKIGQRFRLYVLKVEDSPKGPQIFLSRVFPKFITKLFELEVPEIASGEVEIKSIAREPGSRTKVAVFSNSEEIDPIGSAIGQRGTRVLAVISELGGEKIDIIQYADDPAAYIANALAPAKVLDVEILPKNKAICIVVNDQLSLAIGKEGQNVRLAAKLTGWKIDVRSIESRQAKQKEKETEEEKSEEKSKKPFASSTPGVSGDSTSGVLPAESPSKEGTEEGAEEKQEKKKTKKKAKKSEAKKKKESSVENSDKSESPKAKKEKDENKD